MAEDQDARRVIRPTDRQYPANARRTRPWMYALALPILVGLSLGGVLVYQQIYGGKSVDPLTLNAKARDTVILLPVPDGWTRTEVVTTCPGEPDGCAGGAFLKIGTTSTEWLSPQVGTSVGRDEAARSACQELADQLLARSTAPPLRAADCVPFLAANPGSQADDEAVHAWSDTTGTWAIFTVPRSALPTGEDPKRFGFAVEYTPKP